MGRSACDPRRRPLPSGLLGMLGLVLTIELALLAFESRFEMLEPASWKQNRRAARDEATGCSVLCFGDSLVKVGIAPPVFERILHRRTYNLAVLSGTPPAHYFLLRRVLEGGGRPEMVLVDGELLICEPKRQERLWAELASLPECAELGWNAGDASFFAALATRKLLPSLRLRQDLRTRLQATAGTGPSIGPLITAVFRRNWAVNRGAHIMNTNQHGVRNPLPKIVGSSPGCHWACHPLNLTYLERFLDLATSRGIRVVWLIPPVTPEFQSWRERAGSEADYVRFIRGLRDRYPKLTVVDGSHAGYPTSAFIDWNHLDHQGAASYSADVAKIVGGLLAARTGGGSAGSRWMELPAYRGPSRDVPPLEDFDRSRMVLRDQYFQGMRSR